MKTGCKTVAYFANNCAAVVWSPSGKLAEGQLAESDLSVAKSKALKECGQKAPDCKIVEAVCTNWETIETTTIWW